MRKFWLIISVALAALAITWSQTHHSNSEPASHHVTQPMSAPSLPRPAPDHWPSLTGDQRLADLHARRDADVKAALSSKGFALGDPVYIRVMKESSELELWLKPATATAYKLFQTYRIARFSGTLGPKTKEGDLQAPEGFYGTTRPLMNPASKYHLAFNIGYPNAYDRSLGRTGSFIMVHGKDVSIGCFAMTDPIIEEIYLIVDAALSVGQIEVPVHCYPFRMTAERLAAAKDSEWHEFWQSLKPAWDAFEQTKVPPPIGD
jgi:murein L,D-transpeptidase YafK